MKLTGGALLQVRILSPTKTYYDGKAVAVSAENAVGPFDILANHANFFSLLVASTVYITTENQRYELAIRQGIIKVKHNEVTLFVDMQETVPTTPQTSN